MNTYLGNVFDFNEHLINLGLWNRDFGDREPVGLRYGRQPLIRNETDDYSIRRPTKLLNNLTDLVLGPCLHSLRDLEVSLSVDRHLFVFVWYKKRGI